MTGSARSIAGSDDETGTATLKAIPSASRIDLILPSGLRNEIQNASGASPAGSWAGPDGVVHHISFHNLLNEPAWFSPALPIAHRLSASGYSIAYVGQESRDGESVEHLTISQTTSFAASKGIPSIDHLSQIDYSRDSTTFLPSAVAFNIHPDDNALVDIPVEVSFSDYRAANGSQIPFHIQKFMNNVLVLDLQFDKALVNTGLSASSFQVQ